MPQKQPSLSHLARQARKKVRKLIRATINSIFFIPSGFGFARAAFGKADELVKKGWKNPVGIAKAAVKHATERETVRLIQVISETPTPYIHEMRIQLEDLQQECFCRFWENRCQNFNPEMERPFACYVAGAMHFIALSMNRKGRLERPAHDAIKPTREAVEIISGEEQRGILDKIRDAATKALKEGTIDKEEMETVDDFLSGRNSRQSALKLGLTPSAVRYRRKKALTKLGFPPPRRHRRPPSTG